MTRKDIPLESDALRVNLAGTAQDVVIPERYLPLLQAVASLGVREPVREMLAEYFHRYRNPAAVIEGLQTILLRNWVYFERSEDRARLFALFAELLDRLLDEPLTDAQLSLLVRQIALWGGPAAAGPFAADYAAPLEGLAQHLLALLPRRPLPFLERDSLLRDLARKAAGGAGGSSEQRDVSSLFVRLYRSVLEAGYVRIADRLDLPAWSRSPDAPLNDRATVEQLFLPMAAERVEGYRRATAQASDDEVGGGCCPTFSELLDDAIRAIFRISDLEDRFAVCLFFLKDDTLGYRQHEVMVDLLGVVKLLLAPGVGIDLDRLLARLTRFFHSRENLFPEMRFQIYEAVGVAIGHAGATRAADHIIDDLLSWRFQYPEITGATDEWRTVVNPYHVANIRCWLHIIESAPLLYERLAAALNVQLRLGGVFISDTDLFQRDVTRFLNAEIRPIAFAAKQLLRALPVYFNEVGAEGELRSVSTEVDEICNRRDTLMHFVRKQVHAESSNRLVAFSAAILRYWATVDPSYLEPFLSPNTLAAVRGESRLAEGPHRLLLHLARQDGGDPEAVICELLELSPETLRDRLRDADGGAEEDRRRLELIVRQHQLLTEKYALTDQGLGPMVARHLQLTGEARARFAQALEAWKTAGDGASEAARLALLDASLDVLQELRAIVFSPVASDASENIYHKRHIAAGIPSMYGSYSEPKFDALGLSFRVEALVSRLLEDVVLPQELPHFTRADRRRMAATLRRFERALGVDGIHSQNLSATIELLAASAEHPAFSFRQSQNILQFLAQGISELTRLAIVSHDHAIRTILEHDCRVCEARGLSGDALAEVVLRDILVSALGLQTLDRFVADSLRRLNELGTQLPPDDLDRMAHYDPDRLVSWIHEPDPSTDDRLTLGAKALGLKHLVAYGYRVPEGFILTTELFGASPAMSHRPLYDATASLIRDALHQLEERTGLRLGDPDRLLTLSIRSGAAVSMPGLMDTFINVGLNDELTAAHARRPGLEWSAWDSYRRFLQGWAMSAGVDRDVFDELMLTFKDRYAVGQKLDLTAAQMREVALAYKERARELGVVFIEDPVGQVLACIRKVLESWDAPTAQFYRTYVGVAEEWGTAVIIQRMVLGNLGRGSGAGVTFTRSPQETESRQVRLFGDFAIGSQGEDLVGGLVYPLPISEAQRVGSRTHMQAERSLERDFPQVYEKLLCVARDLVEEREYDPQELEFTFESPAAEDLFLLQKRPMVHAPGAGEQPVFDMRGCDACELPLAVGVGISGGAYAGRVAVDGAQIDELVRQDPGGPILLLRPDTVPEDLGMIVRVQGILTARGGSTSHAAVTARRLGKTAVVDCRALEVNEREGTARLGGHELRPGDWVSIDGRTGHIYLGALPTMVPPSGTF